MTRDAPTPETVLHWIARKKWSVETWIDDHGRKSKRPRPDLDIEHHEEDLAMFDYMEGCFRKALERRAVV